MTESVHIVHPLDNETQSLRTIQLSHSEIHEGHHFTVSLYDQDLDNTETLEYVITVPDSKKWPHIIFSVYGALSTLFQLFESTTHTASTPVNIYNNNRNIATSPTTTIKTSADDGTDGIEIFGRSFGIATGVGVNIKSGGGDTRGDQEWVLRQNTKYLAKVTSSTDNNNVSLVISWYEHTNLD